MHCVMFVDQHPDTLGGMQTSVRLQRRFLEMAGHQVTIVSPKCRGKHATDPAVIELPSIPLGPGEYSMCIPGRLSDKTLAKAMAARGPVDVVHVQADFWQAIIGYRFAKDNNLPVVHTMHNRLDVGIAATMPLPGLVQRGFGLAQKVFLRTGKPVAADAWTYLATLHRPRPTGDGTLQPLRPPAAGRRRLCRRGCGAQRHGRRHRGRACWPSPRPTRTRARGWRGSAGSARRNACFPSLTPWRWPISMPRSMSSATVRTVPRRKPRPRPWTSQPCSSAERSRTGQMLAELRRADALVQTSQGFETQGMTVYEAAALGTPSLLSDRKHRRGPAGGGLLAHRGRLGRGPGQGPGPVRRPRSRRAAARRPPPLTRLRSCKAGKPSSWSGSTRTPSRASGRRSLSRAANPAATGSRAGCRGSSAAGRCTRRPAAGPSAGSARRSGRLSRSSPISSPAADDRRRPPGCCAPARSW